MRTRPVLIALAALALGPPAVGVARSAPPSAAPRPAASITLDSLLVERGPRFTLYAPDVATLQLALRDANQATNTLRRLVGTYPPPVTVAALGTLPDPSRADERALLAAGVHVVALDWPERRRPGADTARRDPPMALTERIGRWQVREYERLNARVPVPAGRARLVPDWCESAIGQLCTSPPEQARRIAWFRERVDQRIPLDRLFTMARPAAPEAAKRPARPAGGGARKPGPSREMFDAQALAFARFLAAREEERMVGDILHTYLRGQPETAAISAGANLFSRHDVLEKAFVEWVKAQPAK